jgi:hypothetical protein
MSLSAKRVKSFINRYGRTFSVIHGAVNSVGLEGSGGDGIPVKGLFDQRPPGALPAGEVDRMRVGDVAGSQYGEHTLSIAALSIDFIPTIDDHVADGDTLYNTVDVQPLYKGEEPLMYTLTIRLI